MGACIVSQRHQRGPQGVRQDRFSGSKVSNLTTFDPWGQAVNYAYATYLTRLGSDEPKPIIDVELNSKYGPVMPLSGDDVRETLDSIPTDFTEGLEGVFSLLGPSKKQSKAESLYRYGTYWRCCIFLFPYPRKWMSFRAKGLQPHILREYERVGAEIINDGNRELLVRFNNESLRDFYLRDVLIHEVGHHVDRFSLAKKSTKDAERFANWFATEYGFKYRPQRPGEAPPISQEADH